VSAEKPGRKKRGNLKEPIPEVVPRETEQKTPLTVQEEEQEVVRPEVEVLPGTTADDLPLPEEPELPLDLEPAPEPEVASREIVPYDALTAYLREIRRFPRLTREEEHELAVKYFKFKDMEAAYRLISSNLWLVVKIARDYERAARSILDLIQEGNIGIMEAVKNFDPYKGVRFPSYAVWWIKAYIIRYVIANWRLVKIGTTQAQRKLFFNLRKERERLEMEGFTPEPKLLAEKLNVKESEVVEMEQRLSAPDMSVDSPLDGDGDTTLLSVLPSEASSAEEILASKEMKQMLRQGMLDFAGTLNENERLIFQERMLSEEKVTLQDMAEKLDLSRERIRQLENRIREKLKRFLQDKLGTALTGGEE
jgi:RNA polymerase sigma-32 factor